jgi:rare lipoprotein A
VQVGAFEKIENARLLARAFAKRGRDVVIQQYPAAGMNLYRVLIFASHSLAQGKVYEKRLKAEGFRYALLLAR